MTTRDERLKEVVSDAYYLLDDLLGYHEMDTDEDGEFAQRVRWLHLQFERQMEAANGGELDEKRLDQLFAPEGSFYAVTHRVGELSRFNEIRGRFLREKDL